MTSTSPSETVEKEDSVEQGAPGLITKASHHPLAQIILGNVVAMQWLGDTVVLYYADHHKARIVVGEDGDLQVGDAQVPTC